MGIVHNRELVSDAYRTGRAIAAFNVITLEHAEAVVAGAERAGKAAILQLSENAVRFHRSARPIAAGMYAVADAASVPIALHMDHVTDQHLMAQAIDIGFSSVMFDASGLAYEINLERTARAVEWGRSRNVWIEAELGEIGGKAGAHAPGVRTDPAEASSFVAATGVDALAVAVGSQHAMAERTAALDLELIERLARTLPVPLVLHGSSGVPYSDLVAAVGAGMVKVNIGTALNVAFTSAIREALQHDEGVVDPRAYLTQGRTAIARTVESVLQVLDRPARVR